MRVFILQLFMSFISSLGFALVFHVRKQRLLWASLGGAFCFTIYTLLSTFVNGIFLPCVIASAMTSVYAEEMAKRNKAPATLFQITGVIPLIPGSCLYYTMSALVQSHWNSARSWGYKTIVYALGIAVGISITSALVDSYRRAKCNAKQKS